MKNIKLKGKGIKILSVFMAAILLLTTMSTAIVCAKPLISASANVSQQEIPAATEEQIKDITDRFDSQYGVIDNILIAALNYIKGNIHKKLEDKAWGKIWDDVFGKSTFNQQIQQKLNQIQSDLGLINGMLVDMRNKLTQTRFHHQIQQKLNLMRDITVAADARMKEYNAAPQNTADGFKARCAILNNWYEHPGTGNGNALDGFQSFCNKVSGVDGFNIDGSFFEQYDKYAQARWKWENQGINFRQLQRARDLQLIIKMASLNLLWIQQARERSPKNEWFFKVKINQMIESIQAVVNAFEKAKVTVRKGVNKFHFGGAKFDIALTTSDQGIVSYRDVFDNNLKLGKETHTTRADSKKMIENKRISNEYHLITRQELKVLSRAADVEGVCVYDLLKDSGGFKSLPSINILFADKENQPLDFGQYRRGKGLRNMYLENADILNKRDDIWTGTKVCEARVTFFDHDKFGVPIGHNRNHGYYEVISKDGDNVKKFRNNNFFCIWVKNSQNVPK